MPVLLSGGRVTFAPEVPSVLNTCQTPTEGLPGSPTVAIVIVTTPRFATGRTGALDPVLVTFFTLAAALSPHPVALTDNAASRPRSASERPLTPRPQAPTCRPIYWRMHPRRR